MTPQPFTKAQRRELRRLAGLAYERELARATGELQAEFERWRRGELDVFVLSERIHEFHEGVSRDLYKRYALGEAEWCVASAIARGVVREPEVDEALLAGLRKAVDLARQLNRESEEA